MKNSGATKTYLALAALLAIAEILLLATGNGKLPISGLILFAFFFASGSQCSEIGEIQRIILYTADICLRFLYPVLPGNVH